MPSLVTRQGIEEAFKHLALKKGTLKARLVEVLDSCFPDDESIQQTKSIPVEDLASKIWNTDSPEEINTKRKNFSSLKSGLNQSLKDLDKKGKNPEGIILGRNNVFIVSEKRKDDILQKLGLSAETPQSLREMFTAFKKIFSEIIKNEGVDEVKDLLNELDEARKVVQEISGLAPVESDPPVAHPLPEGQQIFTTAAPAGKTTGEPSADQGNGDGEDLEVVDEEELEEIVAAQDSGEIVEVEEIGAEVLDDLEEVSAEEAIDDSDIEVVDEDELEEIMAPEGLAEIEEIEEVLEDELAEAVEDSSEAGELEEVPEEEASAADDNIEIIDEADLEEVSAEEVIDDSDIEVVDEDDLEEIETPDAIGELEEVEEVSEEGVLAADGDIEIVDAEDLEETAEEEASADSDIEVVDEDEIEEIEEPDALDEFEEVEEVPEDELTETADGVIDAGEGETVSEEEILSATGEPAGANEGEVEIVDEDDLEEVAGSEEFDGLEEVEEVDEQALEEITEEERTTAADDLEEFIEEAAVDDSDIEVVDEDELEEAAASEGHGGVEETDGNEQAGGFEELIDDAGKAAAGGAPSSYSSQPRSPLAVLSKYLDPEEALIDESQLLHESDEEYAAQILDRFKPKFIRIPAGTYIIGSSHPKPLEQPQREVALDSFYLGQLPVTNDLFDLFVRDTGYVTDAEQAGYGVIFEGRCVTRTDPSTGRSTLTLSRGTTTRQVQGANWRHPAGPGSGLENKHNHPVVQVSRNDAIAFATWAGKKLPSEEEWEAAARGHDGRLFPWGNNWEPDLTNLESSCTGDTTPVEKHGRQSLSPFGLFDMLGNVYEWTASVYQSATGKENANGIRFYVLKGGCWASNGIITGSHRLIERENYWSNTIGFRCAV